MDRFNLEKVSSQIVSKFVFVMLTIICSLLISLSIKSGYSILLIFFEKNQNSLPKKNNKQAKQIESVPEIGKMSPSILNYYW